LLSTFFVSCWAYYEGRHLSLSLRRKITVDVFYSTFTNVFFIFVTFLRFLTFLKIFFGGNVFFIYAMKLQYEWTYSSPCTDDVHVYRTSSRACSTDNEFYPVEMSNSRPSLPATPGARSANPTIEI